MAVMTYGTVQFPHMVVMGVSLSKVLGPLFNLVIGPMAFQAGGHFNEGSLFRRSRAVTAHAIDISFTMAVSQEILSLGDAASEKNKQNGQDEKRR